MFIRVRPVLRGRQVSAVRRLASKVGDNTADPQRGKIDPPLNGPLSGDVPLIRLKLADVRKPHTVREQETNSEQEPHGAEETGDGGSPKSRSGKSRVVFAVVAAGLAGAYYYTTTNTATENTTDLLRPDQFVPFVVTYKQKYDEDHYLIELTRKQYNPALASPLFDGAAMWSVEIKQPDINIVRNYTPLPLYVDGTDPETNRPRLRLLTRTENHGRFLLLVKRYNTGEFSRWLTNRKVFDEVQLRGPCVEYKLPQTLPETVAFYGAGTGVLPLLQLLYTPGAVVPFVHAFVSLHKHTDLPKELFYLNWLAEQRQKAKFRYLISEAGERLTAKQMAQPAPFQPLGSASTAPLVENEAVPDTKVDILPKKSIWDIFKRTPRVHASFAFVCGPETYTTFVSGRPNLNNLGQIDTGAIGGLLAQNQWTLANIKRLL
ncbi:hypothetical protein OGAPHI_001679 [Ogataea philodendri]|uniref:FAD-binding FR-type domain-containing protein n=1 Tax=Ogataea philodendri TaxID=1378263 RepID=A0A9P8PB90_9ASCO|nr:uncharacterized protein OGAPHI_001679 [Ogataea philodendri]KAH3669083.1 hypothetical protein OGAPHI_001679 [Ogataea philodendri]